MAEHTLGPWEYDGGAQIVEAARPHMRIAFLPSDHHEYASSEANARLIAAAPDLLAFAEYVAEIDTGNPAPLFVKARAVIAKATGAEPSAVCDGDK